MKQLVSTIRAELTPAGERAPPVVLAMAGLIVALPFLFFAGGVSDVAASIIALLFLFWAWRNNDFAWARQTWVLIGLALWAFLVVRGFTSIDPMRSGPTSLVWIRFLIFAAAVQFALTRSPAMRRALLLSICAMAVFGAADALLQYAAGYDLFGQPIIASERSDGAGGTVINYRLTGPLEVQAIGRLLLFAGLPAIIYFLTAAAAHDAAWRNRLLGAAGFALVLAAIIMSGERMVLLLTILALGIIVLVLMWPSPRTLLILVASGAVTAGTLLAAFPQARIRHLSTITEIGKAESSLYGRGMLAGIDVFKDNVLFGVGMKNFRKACPAHVTNPNVMEACRLIHPHHLWVQWLAETGVVGFLGFVGLIISALLPALRRWRSWATDALLAGAAISVLLRIWPIATSGNFFSNWREVMFWFTVGVAALMPAWLQKTAEDKRGASGN